jgi:autotransporter-associated beta strand protein
MKNLTNNSLNVIAAGFGLLFILLANHAGAGILFWDNNGTSTPSSGTWDTTTKNWSPSATGILTSSTIAFTNGAAAVFCAATTSGPVTNGNTTLTITVTAPNISITALDDNGIDGARVPTLIITNSGSGSLSLAAGTDEFYQNTVAAVTVYCPITGTGALSQNGSGTLALYGNNTYSGGTYFTGGQVLYYNNNNSFGTGPIYVTGTKGALVASGTAAITVTNDVYLTNGIYTVNLAGGNLVSGAPGTTFSGNFYLYPNATTTLQTSSTTTEVTKIGGVVSGSGASLQIDDYASLWLGGVNTYDGNTIITNSVAGSNPSTTLTLALVGVGSLGSGNYAGSILNAGIFLDASSATQILSGQIFGPGTLVISNANANLALSGYNTYTGNTTIYNGVLNINSSTVLGTGTLVISGGTIDNTSGGDVNLGAANPLSVKASFTFGGSGTLELGGAVTLSASPTITVNGVNALTLNGVIGGAYAITKAGPGTLVFGAANTYTGNTTVNAGTLQLAAYNAVPATSTVTIASGATLDLNGQSDTIKALSLSGSGTGGSGALTNSSYSASTLTCPITLAAATTIGGPGNITLPGPIIGLSLTYAGAGTLTLGGTNTYTGGTIINSGTLDGSVASSIPGNATVNGTGVLELDNSAAMSPTATLTIPDLTDNAVFLNFTGTQSLAGLVIGSTPQPPGVYGANAINPNSAFNSSGSGYINVGQTYWDANHTDAASQSSAHGGGSGIWDNSTADWWVSGSSDVAWAGGNVAAFAGTAGTVTVNDNVVAAGLTFTTPGYTINNTNGTSALTLGGNIPAISVPAGIPTTISCSLAGGGAVVGLTASGPGTLVLSGANTYTGGTMISSGAALSVNAISDSGPSALGVGAGPLTLGNVEGAGASLAFTGASGLTAATVTLNGTSTSTLTVPSGSTLELDGHVSLGTDSATPALAFTGGGTLIMGGISNDNSGLTLAIQQGKVIINKTTYASAHGLGGGASSVGTGTAGNSAQLQLSGSGNYDLYSGCVLTVNGVDGLLDLNGQSDSMSTLTLSGAGPNNLGVLINSAATTSSLTNGGSAVVLAGNTTIGGSGNITLVSKVSGASSLTYAGTGTLTLGAANTYSGGTTINAGGTVQLNNVAGAGTGTITLNGNGVLHTTVIGTYANAITGGSTGVINLEEPAGNTFLSGDMSGFSGTINCLTATTTGQLVLSTPGFAINAAATWNIAYGATVAFQGSNTYPSKVIVAGIGNNQAYGSFRLDAGCTQTGNVLLAGTNVLFGGGFAGASTISGVISDGGNGYGFTKVGNAGATMILSATNTYSGPTTNSAGTLAIGGAGQLGSGNYAANLVNNATFNYASSAAQTLSGVISGTGLLAQSGPGTLNLSGANTYTGGTLITNGSTLAISGAGSLGNGAYAGNITNYGVLSYASSAPQTLSGVISGAGTLTQSGSGTLTLSGTDTYTGGTTISGGTLALASTGSINSSPSLTIAAGATFDVSAYTSYWAFSGSTTLKARGTGTGVGTTAATIKGGSSAAVILGSVVLTFTPQTFAGDATHPALYISQGALTLNGTGITVTNAAATPLGAGTYSLIQVAGGNLTLLSTNITVAGTGLAPGTAASLAVSGGSLNLVVTTTVVPQPVINSVTLSGTNLIFSGTNGSGSNFYVLTSTNVALPLSQWTTNAINTFGPGGVFSVTNGIGSGSQFFIIGVP